MSIVTAATIQQLEEILKKEILNNYSGREIADNKNILIKLQLGLDKRIQSYTDLNQLFLKIINDYIFIPSEQKRAFIWQTIETIDKIVNDILISTPLKFTKGIGEKRAELFGKLDIFSIKDLINHVPRKYIDRTKITKIKDISPNTMVTFICKIIRKNDKRIYFKKTSVIKLYVTDETGEL